MRKMNCAKFNFDVFTKTLTISKTFERNAAIYQSTEQKMMKKYMEAYGDALTIRYYKSRNIHQGLTFEQMENYIGYTREAEENLKRFQDVKELSKSQKSPYKYIKDWFLQEYSNYSATPEFDEDGFVVVKKAPDPKETNDNKTKPENAESNEEKTAEEPVESTEEAKVSEEDSLSA